MPEEGYNFPRVEARLCAPARSLSGPGALAPRRLSGWSSPRARGLPRPPVTHPRLSDRLLRGPALPVGSAGAMERAAGPLRNAYSDPARESKAPGAPGAPLDCGVRGCGPSAEPRAPRGAHAGAPHPAPEPLRCPGGAFLPAIPHPEERRALGVRPGPASSALAAPGQPRDSARWMLCVVEAELKVSGVWARSSGSAGRGGWGWAWGGCLWFPRAQGGLAPQKGPSATPRDGSCSQL